MVKRFSQFLIDHCEQPLNEQGKALNQYYNDWKGENEQVDDVMVLGVKLS
jgi:hypothetical protein